MVLVGELVGSLSDLPKPIPESQAKIQAALAGLGFAADDELGVAFRSLTAKELKEDGGLLLREAKAVLAAIAALDPAPGLAGRYAGDATEQSGRQQAGAPPVTAEEFRALTDHVQTVETELRVKMRDLEIQANRSMQTTRSDQELGEVYRELMETKVDLFCLCPVPEGDPCLEDAERAALAQFPACAAAGRRYVRPNKRLRLDDGEQQSVASSSTSGQQQGLVGASLMDLIGQRSDLQEVRDMQPAMIKLLVAIARELGSSVYITDTHSSTLRMSSPVSQPDVTALASPNVRKWAQAVWSGEWKLSDAPDQLATAYGQQIKRTRFTFDAQDESRKHAVSLIVTMNSLELLMITKEDMGKISILSTGQHEFSIDRKSVGFQLLVRLLVTPADQLGYVQAAVPQLSQLGRLPVSNLQLIRKGTVAAGSGSYVWTCQTWQGSAILKLNRDDREANLLQRLVGVPHVVQLVARGTCDYIGERWHAVLLQPVVTHLTPGDSLLRVAQVAHDVATGLQGCTERDIAHRDTTEGNIGYDTEGRGCLLDFSAGKHVPGHDWSLGIPADSPMGKDMRRITGTLIAAPLSVLRGELHSISSMLEGIFLSVINIASNGHITGHDLGTDNPLRWELIRAGALHRRQLPEEGKIIDTLKPLVHALHSLFYPLPTDSSDDQRRYNKRVTVAQFKAACQAVCNNKLWP